jgi:hypothetical protein
MPLVAGAFIPIAISGLVDAWTWGLPFASTIDNIRLNLIGGLAATFARRPSIDTSGSRFASGRPRCRSSAFSPSSALAGSRSGC